jgi:GNAT superfamily N-acetyltransferase
MPEGVLVRPMETGDVGAALAAVASHDPGLVGEARASFERALAEEGPPRMLVAELGGEVAGVMGYSPDPWGVADVWWTEWLFVLPEARRHGVATALSEEIERQLIARGCRKAYLDIGNAERQAAAIAFHRSQGYEQEGALRDFWAEGEDFLVFGKRLDRVQAEPGPS